MESNELLSIAEFAQKAGITRQAVYSQLNNRLKPYCQVVDKQKRLEIRALWEVFGIEVEQPCQPKLDNGVNPTVNPESTEEIRFLRGQVEQLQAELMKEREHNREKDRQLLETLGKLAESQAALSTGQAAEKQKALAETIISAQRPRLLDAVTTWFRPKKKRFDFSKREEPLNHD